MAVAQFSQETASAYTELSPAPCISHVVEAIGDGDFAEQLLDFLADFVGAYHCAVFQGGGGGLKEVASAGLAGTTISRADLTLYDMTRHMSQLTPSKVRVDISDLDGAQQRGLGFARRERIVISVQRGQTSYCLRILRTSPDGSTGNAQLHRLRESAGLLAALVVRHVVLSTAKPNLPPAFTCLEHTEDCLLASTDLSRREAEVCSRILYGLSSCGIALDLRIGKESVVTYRKRAYQRLGIGSKHELLMWYLTLWSHAREKALTVN